MSPTIPELPVLIGNGRDESHPVPQSQVTMTQLMAPQDTNLMGNVFGGVILAAVDRIAYVCATRHAGRPCVTASFDQVDFRSPIQIGEVVTVRAEVTDLSPTTVTVLLGEQPVGNALPLERQRNGGSGAAEVADDLKGAYDRFCRGA